jgi:hypothetical protein
MRRGSAAWPAIEQVRSRLATRSPSGTSRGGSGVGVAVGSTAAAEPTLTPANTAPVPSSTNTTAIAPMSQPVGCFANSAPMPRGEPGDAGDAAAWRAARREIGCSSVTSQ